MARFESSFTAKFTIFPSSPSAYEYEHEIYTDRYNYYDIGGVWSDDSDEAELRLHIYARPKNHSLYVKFTLINLDPQESLTEELIYNVQDKLGFYWDTLKKKVDLLDVTKGWLVEDRLSVSVTFSLLQERINWSTKVNKYQASSLNRDIIKHVTKNSKNLLLCSNDGKEFAINETFFAARSELLETHLKYKKNNRLTFDWSGNLLEELVHFIDCDTIRESAEPLAFDLAELAHMYDLPGLFSLVERYLIAQTPRNLVRAIKVANLFDSHRLYQEIGRVEEIEEERFESGAKWQIQLEEPALLLEINEDFLRVKYPHSDWSEEKLTRELKAVSSATAQGFISYLKTSTVAFDGEGNVFDYAHLAEKFALLDLEKKVETELVSNASKYHRQTLKDYAEKMKSFPIFRALAAEGKILAAFP